MATPFPCSATSDVRNSSLSPPPFIEWLLVSERCVLSILLATTFFFAIVNLKEEDIQHIKDPTDNRRYFFLLRDYFGWICADVSLTTWRRSIKKIPDATQFHRSICNDDISFFLFSHCQQEKNRYRSCFYM